jgi:hypothetical protein
VSPYIIGAAVAAAFIAGWTASDWHSDSLELVANKAAQASAGAAMWREASTAQTIETALARLRANEKVIYRETVKLVDRPVYRNVCLDADGLRIINAAKNGADPSVIAPAVPGP